MNPSRSSNDHVVVANENMPSNNNISNNIDRSAIEAPSSSDDMTKKASSISAPPPSYTDSQASPFYQSASALLKAGDFEAALAVLEEALATGTADTCDPLHESRAPFHYLYGTTLLYSIEETGAEALTTAEGNEEDEAAASAAGVEDMEIAWEHLETARTILERLLRSDEAAASEHTPQRRLDLAQVLLRAGDLQRLNGALHSAVTDYTACLNYYDAGALPRYSRKRADVHANLGAVYFLLVVQAKQQQQQQNPAAPPDDGQMAFHRGRGFHHYFECACTLAGMIAQARGLGDPEWLTSASTCCYNSNVQQADCPASICAALRTLRQSIVTAIDVGNDDDEVADYLALLEEIQETLDEAETSEQGVVEATAMKEEIAALVAAQEDAVETNPFGSVAAAASTAVAQTIPLVRKKKRVEKEAADDDDDVKCPADPTKRVKSSE